MTEPNTSSATSRFGAGITGLTEGAGRGGEQVGVFYPTESRSSARSSGEGRPSVWARPFSAEEEARFFTLFYALLDDAVRRETGGYDPVSGNWLEQAGLDECSRWRAARLLNVPATRFIAWVDHRELPDEEELEGLLAHSSLTDLGETDKKDLRVLRDVESFRRSADEERLWEERDRARRLQAMGQPPTHRLDQASTLYKPDPKAITTPEDFVEAMVRFREWAGGEELASRKLAYWSKGAFSHSTINRILSLSTPFSSKPRVKLSYVAAFIEACGGTTRDVEEWNAAWRRAYKQMPKVRRPAQTDALPAREQDEVVVFTAKERQIAELLVQGLASRQIAEQLNIGHSSVHMQVRRILAKLGVDTTVEAVAKLHRNFPDYSRPAAQARMF